MHYVIKYNAALFFIVLLSCFSCSKKNIRLDQDAISLSRIHALVDDKGKVSEPLQKLMDFLGLAPADTLDEAVMYTQKTWLRKAGLERSWLEEKYHKEKPVILKSLDHLGLMMRVMPTKTDYDYVLVLGAMYKTFKIRLQFLEQLVASGLRVKNIALLGSLRPLDPTQELSLIAGGDKSASLPTNEIEMMESLFAQSSLKTLPVIAIRSPMKLNQQGQIIRANTLDTILDFQKLSLKPGHVLVISNQPYIVRQDLVTRSVLGSPWTVETVGPMAEGSLPTDVYLDELARVLFEIKTHFHDLFSPRLSSR